MPDAYSAMLGTPQILGAPEILGDPATAVPTAADQDITKYTQKGYTASDKIYFGIGDGGALAAGAEVLFRQSVQTPFKPLRLTMASQYVPDIVIVQVKIGSVDLVEGAPVPAEVWSEVSENNCVSWPTLDVSQELQIRLRNRGLIDIAVDIGVYGVRLRTG